MTGKIAFIGDVHGNYLALRGLLTVLAKLGEPHMVFLGDYLNKGSHSQEVLSELIHRSRMGQATLLAGNHELAFLDAFRTGDLSLFLRIGGAATIRSYVGTPVEPDVLQFFKSRFPADHLEAIKNMPLVYETGEVIAQHLPSEKSSRKFQISAHIPTGKLPLIGKQSAQLDTGCGSQDGRLTALFWPSLDFIQVDSSGQLVSDHTAA